MKKVLLRHKLFQNLTEEHLSLLEALCETLILDTGQTLISEGDRSFDLFLLIEGEVGIFKNAEDGHPYLIRKKRGIDLIGELGFIESGPRSTTVKTFTKCQLIKIDGLKIRSDPKYLELFADMTMSMGKLISDHLRYTNEVTVKSIKAELATAKKLLAVGRFMTTIVFLTSVYIFSLSFIMTMKTYMPTTPITIGLLLAFSSLSLVAVLKSGLPLEEYGLTSKDWKRVSVEAILFTLPLMVLILCAKYFIIRLIPGYQNSPLFQPFEILQRQGVTSPLALFLIPFLYALFCPIQEFVARGVLQSSFRIFLHSDTWQSKWFAIVMGNLLFAATHAHLTLSYALLAFFPGLFWGWLFAREKSLVGVSISHILIGIWAVFIVGFPFFH